MNGKANQAKNGAALRPQMKLNMADKVAFVYITGEIGCDEGGFWQDGYCLKNWQDDYTAALNAGAEKIVLRINSPGGSLFEGFALHDAVKASAIPVECEVLGLCASAATLVAYACQTVRIGAHSYLGLHEPFTCLFGTVDECAAQLEKFKDYRGKAFSVYASVTGRSVEDVLAELKEEKMYSAEKAVELGWANAVLSTDEDKPEDEPEEKPEDKPAEDKPAEDAISKMGLDELRAELGKRHATPVIERIKARIAELEAHEALEGTEPEAPEDKPEESTEDKPADEPEDKPEESPEESPEDGAPGMLDKFKAWMKSLLGRAGSAASASETERMGMRDPHVAYKAAMASASAAQRAERAARADAAAQVEAAKAQQEEAERRAEMKAPASVPVSQLPPSNGALKPGKGASNARAAYEMGGINAVLLGRRG